VISTCGTRARCPEVGALSVILAVAASLLGVVFMQSQPALRRQGVLAALFTYGRCANMGIQASADSAEIRRPVRELRSSTQRNRSA